MTEEQLAAAGQISLEISTTSAAALRARHEFRHLLVAAVAKMPRDGGDWDAPSIRQAMTALGEEAAAYRSVATAIEAMLAPMNLALSILAKEEKTDG